MVRPHRAIAASRVARSSLRSVARTLPIGSADLRAAATVLRICATADSRRSVSREVRRLRAAARRPDPTHARRICATAAAPRVRRLRFATLHPVKAPSAAAALRSPRPGSRRRSRELSRVAAATTSAGASSRGAASTSTAAVPPTAAHNSAAVRLRSAASRRAGLRFAASRRSATVDRRRSAIAVRPRFAARETLAVSSGVRADAGPRPIAAAVVPPAAVDAECCATQATSAVGHNTLGTGQSGVTYPASGGCFSLLLLPDRHPQLAGGTPSAASGVFSPRHQDIMSHRHGAGTPRLRSP
jgi:hypothetical protein